jgi:hypothetical protein
MDCLKQAVLAGYSAEELKANTELEPLRSRPDVRALQGQ